MPTRIFDAATHAFYVTTHDGITVAMEGEPDGDNFLATYEGDAVTGTPGAKGDIQWSQIIISKGIVTKTMQWGSESNQILQKIFADQQNQLYPQKGELKRISGTENVTEVTCSRLMITKPADLTEGVAAANRPWAFQLEKMKFPEEVAPA